MGKRRQYGREAWDRACKLIEAPDEFATVSTGGMWTARKLFFLCCYLEQTCRGMHSNNAFPDGLVFVDLFCGSGVCSVRDQGGKDHRYPGSAVIAASLHERPFQQLFLVDEDPAALHAATTRSRRAGFAGDINAYKGDVNKQIDTLVARLPRRALSIAFVDPYSLQVHYTTIETLAKARSVDLIILISDRIDLIRNIEQNYYPRKSDKLDLFLGEQSDWRVQYDALHDRSFGKLTKLFADVYLEQLARLGYDHNKSWPLEGPQGPMFRLAFASKASLGLKYCEIALREDFGGERGLFGP